MMVDPDVGPGLDDVHSSSQQPAAVSAIQSDGQTSDGTSTVVGQVSSRELRMSSQSTQTDGWIR